MAKNKQTKRAAIQAFLIKYVTWRNIGLIAVLAISFNNYSVIKLLLDQDQSIELVAGAVTIGLATIYMIGSVVFKTKE